MGASSSQPWRVFKHNNEETLEFVKSYKPKNEEAKHLRILLCGPVGAGKSSFINSVESVVQGRITNRALTDATFGSSFTDKYTTYKLHKDPENICSVIFNDIMGFEQKAGAGVNVEDIKLILKGHVTEGYEFNPGDHLKNTDQAYNATPTLDDKVHVLVYVIPVNSVSLTSDEVVKKMREVRKAASDMGIPQLAILTKVDDCPKMNNNLKNTYVNEYLKEQVDKFSSLLGLQPNCIYLVKNYHKEVDTNGDVDGLILSALRPMIHFGEDFLNNLAVEQ